MPLTELMNYFNDQLKIQVRTKSLPATGFYKADGSYWARFGSLILGSNFHPVQAVENGDVLGYEAELVVRSSTGNKLNIDSIFNSLDSGEQIVHLDRLVRTLHSLNSLQQFDGQDYILSLQVQPRHIISVSEDHGKTFELILSDCGLKPDRVLLHTRLVDMKSATHFVRAFDSYKNHGYKIGINLTQRCEIDLISNLGLVPDVIFVHHASLAGDGSVLDAPQVVANSIKHLAKQSILVSEDMDVAKQYAKIFDALLIVPTTIFDNINLENYFTV